MIVMVFVGIAGATIYAIGHVIGLAHGIETERKRWKLRTINQEDSL